MNRNLLHSLLAIVPILIGVAVIIIPIFVWFGCRIEVEPGQFAVLVRKTGEEPPAGTIISTPEQKGIQLDVLSEGRFFYNPIKWDWSKFPMTDIPQGKLGVVFRKYGADLPPGEIMAKDGTKGILPDVLGPGKHRLNPFAYDVQVFDAITIQPGEVGVMVSLVGEDPLNGNPESVNTFTVNDGEKGVIIKTLDPGTYYLNPYVVNVIPVNLQSNRVELSGEDAIDFLTIDGFPVKAEGTVEYAINRDNAAILTHKVGDSEDILKKIILPRVRGLARIEGSKGSALTYIVGERRQEFQDKLTEALKTQCGKWGVEIRSILIRNITPPDQISSIIRERELATQKATMFEQQITQAQSEAELEKQRKLAIQNKEKVTAETAKLRAKIEAEQQAQVRLTSAQQNLEVAKLQKAAAEEQAGGIRAKAQGEATVIKANNEARAGVLTQQAQAFGSGEEYSRYLFLQSVAPNIESVLANDGPGGLGEIFSPFTKSGVKAN